MVATVCWIYHPGWYLTQFSDFSNFCCFLKNHKRPIYNFIKRRTVKNIFSQEETVTSVNLGKDSVWFQFFYFKNCSACVCVCIACVCIRVLLGWRCKVRRNLRNCNTNGVNIPYDSKYFQNTTKPTISTLYRIFFARSHWSQKWEKPSSPLFLMFCHIYPVLEEGLFFLAHLKTRLELNYPSKEKAALESWNLVGSERRVPFKVLRWVV